MKQPHPHIAHQPPHIHHLIIRTRNKVNELANNIYIYISIHGEIISNMQYTCPERERERALEYLLCNSNTPFFIY